MAKDETGVIGGRWFRWVAALVFVGAAAGVAWGMFRFKAYVEESPRFCQSCHDVSPEIAVWVESRHRTVRCQQCHHNSLEEGVHILRSVLVGHMPVELHARVDNATCGSCHRSHDLRWPSIVDSRGHQIHVDDEAIACTKCHGEEMHFDVPPRAACGECHEKEQRAAGHQSEHCLACHDFLTTEGVIRPSRNECRACHPEGAKSMRMPASAPMHLRCSECHVPHEAERLVECGSCHTKRELVGLHEAQGHERCTDCHRPHEWKSGVSSCGGCHGALPSRHPEGASCLGCHRFQREAEAD